MANECERFLPKTTDHGSWIEPGSVGQLRVVDIPVSTTHIASRTAATCGPTNERLNVAAHVLVRNSGVVAHGPRITRFIAAGWSVIGTVGWFFMAVLMCNSDRGKAGKHARDLRPSLPELIVHYIVAGFSWTRDTATNLAIRIVLNVAAFVALFIAL